MKYPCENQRWIEVYKLSVPTKTGATNGVRLLSNNIKEEQIKHLIKTYKNNFYYSIPCGKCSCCKKNESREWCTRMTLESLRTKYDYEAKSMVWYHPYVYMVLLTYNNENLPKIEKNNKKYAVVEKKDIELFFKKYREYTKAKCSYFLVSEYGGKNDRPHYHCILYTDKPLELNEKQYSITKKGNITYQCTTLEKIWGKGIVRSTAPMEDRGEAKAFRYCSGYLNKTGNRRHIVKEFKSTSRRPALGRWYFDKYKEQIFNEFQEKPGAFCINGGYMSAPLYFKRLLKRYNKDLYEKLQKKKYEDFKNRILRKNYKLTTDEAIQSIGQSVRKMNKLKEMEIDDSWYEEHQYDYGCYGHEVYFDELRRERQEKIKKEWDKRCKQKLYYWRKKNKGQKQPVWMGDMVAQGILPFVFV